MTERITACFSGTVQGVGFRYTAVAIAQRFPGVSGYVRNLPDGRVEMVAEGEVSDIDSLVDAVKMHMSGYIRRSELQRDTAVGEFHGFTIRY